jgi:hypothetical protein
MLAGSGLKRTRERHEDDKVSQEQLMNCLRDDDVDMRVHEHTVELLREHTKEMFMDTCRGDGQGTCFDVYRDLLVLWGTHMPECTAWFVGHLHVTDALAMPMQGSVVVVARQAKLVGMDLAGAWLTVLDGD